jgi:hypothetical protein
MKASEVTEIILLKTRDKVKSLCQVNRRTPAVLFSWDTTYINYNFICISMALGGLGVRYWPPMLRVAYLILVESSEEFSSYQSLSSPLAKHKICECGEYQASIVVCNPR